MNYAKLFLQSKKVYSFPKRNNILIYDDINYNYLKSNYKNIDFGLLEARGKTFNLPILIISIFYSFYKKKNLKLSYFYNYVKFVKPKFLITFFDNNVFFYSLSTKLKLNIPSIKTISYQNGLRQNNKGDIFDLMGPSKILSCDYIFTLSKSYNSLYKTRIRSEIIDAGSFKSNELLIHHSNIKFKYTFISQLENFQKNSTNFLNDNLCLFYKSENHLLNYLNSANFIKDHDINILLRSDLPEEQNYFNNIFKTKKINFIKKSINFQETYNIIDRSDIVITIDSTLGIEAISRNIKTIFISTRCFYNNVQSSKFGWPIEYTDIGPFWTNQPDNKEYDKIFKNIINIDLKEWSMLLKNYTEIISRDFKNKKFFKLINHR